MAAEIKPLAGLNRSKLSDIVPIRTPFSVFIFPTTYCNFKCAYCGHSLGPEKMFEEYGLTRETMTMETFNKILDGLKEFPDKIKQISLTGHGEPLLNPNIAKMVKALKDADVTRRIEIISNASLLTNSLAQDLVDSGLDCLRVSIQGVKSEKYKEVCSVDYSFEEIVENLRYFSHIKKSTQLFVKVMDIALDGKKEEDIFYNTFRPIADRMFIEHCRSVYTGVDFTKQLTATADRYGRTHEHRQVCPLPFFMLGIFPNGDTEPCDAIYKPVILGNVHDMPLLQMWNGSKLREFQKMQLEKERSHHAKCGTCCAPDDVSHPEDVLDDHAEEILGRAYGGNS